MSNSVRESDFSSGFTGMCARHQPCGCLPSYSNPSPDVKNVTHVLDLCADRAVPHWMRQGDGFKVQASLMQCGNHNMDTRFENKHHLPEPSGTRRSTKRRALHWNAACRISQSGNSHWRRVAQPHVTQPSAVFVTS